MSELPTNCLQIVSNSYNEFQVAFGKSRIHKLPHDTSLTWTDEKNIKMISKIK